MTHKILVAHDGSDNALRALDLAAEFSAKLKADLTIIHVLMHGRPAEEMVRMAEAEHMVERAIKDIEPQFERTSGPLSDFFDQARSDMETSRIVASLGEQLVENAKARCERAGAQHVTTLIRSGDYADAILEVAKEQSADIIVIGSRGLGVVRGFMLGSVSHKVVQHADQTVVTVK
ncbi:MAG: universal stress protein [Paracoccaceae bacterium]